MLLWKIENTVENVFKWDAKIILVLTINVAIK